MSLPMPKAAALEMWGTVQESLPDASFRVRLTNGRRVLARISGAVRMQYVRIAPGDKVAVELSPYDLSRGLITQRMR